MAWYRKLPSGLWAATVYLPNGDRVTESRDLKGDIEKWAKNLESSFDSAGWIDPRGAKVKVEEIWDRWTSKRRQAKNSRQRDHSHWRVYVQPRWGSWPCGAVLKPDIEVWVTELEEKKVGAASIQAAVGVLRATLESAVDAKLIAYNVAKGKLCPDRDAHLDRVLDDDEMDLLLDNAERRFPGRPDARLLLEMMGNCGLRYEEAAAVDPEHVDRRRRLFHIGPVIEKDGTIKPFPKSKAAIRPVPIDDHMWPLVAQRMLVTPPGRPLVVMPAGGNMRYDSWRDRVYQRCLVRIREWTPGEIELWKAQRRAAGEDLRRWLFQDAAQLLDDPQPTPHDLRHTFGTRCGEAGIPAHEIMALMGHETLESVQRYLHARDGRFDKARQMTMALRRRP